MTLSSHLSNHLAQPGSSPEELFENHFQVEDELLDEMLHDSPAEDDGVTGAAANQIPEPETERTPESGRPEDENNDEPGEGILNLWK